MRLGKKIWKLREPVFFTSDTHFGHALTSRQRGFLDKEELDPERVAAGIQERDEWLVSVWNATIPKGATVFHLGDFCIKGTADQRQALFSRLNGLKHLVIGNHDHGIDQTLKLPWSTLPEHRRFLEIGGTKIVLDHYAGRSWAGSNRGSLLLHGHSHGRMPATRQSCDVGIDVWRRPVTLEEILPYLEGQPAMQFENDGYEVSDDQFL